MSNDNIFNIKSNYNFLPSLVSWVLENYPDPLLLTNVTILLPSQRLVREIKKVFLEQSHNSAIILPKIMALEDVDGDVSYNNLLSVNNTQKHDPIHYQLLLIEEIKKWQQKTHFFGKHLGSSTLIEIAYNLQTFLDEIDKEQLDLDNLIDLEEYELADHKQKILEFLRHFGSNWRNILIKNNLYSQASYRNYMLDSYANHIKTTNHPIIAAGSTGSIKATANLLKTISELENGKIILFGLDQNLSEEIWQKIDEKHGQFMLKKLLTKINISRNNIKEIAYQNFQQSDNSINQLNSLINLPAEYSHYWSQTAVSEQFANLQAITVKNNSDQAKIIAIILRKALEEPHKKAALISNDRNLIAQVKTNLDRWDINIDDSGINNLSESNLANYLFLISEFLSNDFSVINLLAILKHPFIKVGDKKYLTIFELEILRDVVSFESFKDLSNFIAERNQIELFHWLQEIIKIFQVAQKEFNKKNNDFKILLTTHIECASKLMASNIATHEEFAEFYSDATNEMINFDIEPKSYNHLLNNLLKNYQFGSLLANGKKFHPRLQILSTIEARLLNHDLTIISDLCEGDFPSKTTDDWLGNKIRTDFGLPSLNKNIGVAAYDFSNYLGGKEVILTYPQSKNNSPTLKSRFLLKLETILKINYHQIADGKYYQQLLKLSTQGQSKQSINRPSPVVKKTIDRLSTTDVSKFLRDPYYLYAKRILRLKPLKSIEQEPSFAEFGNFVHRVLENFIKDYQKIAPEQRLEKLVNDYGKNIFDDYFPSPHSRLLWWPKFENIAKWFIKKEVELRVNLAQILVEVEAEIIINNIILTTKIDRVNFYKDGRVTIIDYKSGILPRDMDVTSGLEPQLAVEAIIITQGNIKNYPELNNQIKVVNNLEYWNLKGRDQNEIKERQDSEELIAAADSGVKELMNILSENNFSYICCPNFEIYQKNDYYHLARIEEWEN